MLSFLHIVGTTTEGPLRNESSTMKTTVPNTPTSNANSTLPGSQNKSKYDDFCCSALLISWLGFVSECFPALQEISALPAHPSIYHQTRQPFSNLDWVLNLQSIHSHNGVGVNAN